MLYGAFAAKVLVVRSHKFPGRTWPVAGALLFCSSAPLVHRRAVAAQRVPGAVTVTGSGGARRAGQ
ncbi:DUF6529 family protein [Streptomyces sp. NPDC002935]|uniref:DUF6529 family protein n=1 Tax=Streptomyces sp. NPDC002935 TaxID=3154545 RepID=UPI0033A4C54B